MQKITTADIKNIYEYEKMRDFFRKEIIEIKKDRRISVGDSISLVFENRETALFQIQEMLRAERIVDEGKIADEVETYNALIPGDRELSATLFIETKDQRKIMEELNRFLGLDSGNKVYFEVGEETVPGIFETGRSQEDKISSVHYVRFKFTDELIRSFVDRRKRVYLVIDHPNYRKREELDMASRISLARDFGAKIDAI